MKKQLFFDDVRLFGRDNVKRVYGRPIRIAEYNDGVCSTDYCTGNVFRLDNGRYRMLYFGHSTQFDGKKLFSAISDDGIHFTPEALNLAKRDYPHEIMQLPEGAEIASIYEDVRGGDRYKLLMAEHDREGLAMRDVLYVSDDLILWTRKDTVFWGDGAEPLASVYYNKHKDNYTILQRPFWGVRAVGCKTTKDWRVFAEYRNVLGVDSRDESLAEMYGMYGFEYDGMYIGVPHMYRGLHSEYNAKYKDGIIDCQLAYSYDGEYWRRSLDTPFLTGGDELPLCWLAGMSRRDDGDILFYGSASELVHGPAFHKPGRGRLCVYRLRRDGFIALESEDEKTPVRVITREKVWHGGEMHLNIKAEDVRVAVYITDESEEVAGNVLGKARALEGYSAEDCISFTGDSTDHVPTYKNGKTLNDLTGATLVFEISYRNGSLYSFSGNYTDVYGTQGARYRKLGTLPEKEV